MKQMREMGWRCAGLVGGLLGLALLVGTASAHASVAPVRLNGATDWHPAETTPAERIKVAQNYVPLDHLKVSGPLSVNENTGAQLTCTAYYTDGSTEDVTGKVAWSVNSADATVNASGYFLAGSVSASKKVTVTAEYLEKTASYDVQIMDIPPVLVRIEVSGPPTVDEKTTGEYTCTAYYLEGPSADVTAKAVWTENTTYTSFPRPGALKAECVPSYQECTITVQYGGLTVTKAVTIVDLGPVMSYVLLEGPRRIDENTTVQYRLVAYHCEGDSEDLTDCATWTEDSDYTTVTDSGELTAVRVPDTMSFRLTAVCGDITRTTFVTVVHYRTLTAIEITGPAEIDETTCRQWRCIGYYDDGLVRDVTEEVAWSAQYPLYSPPLAEPGQYCAVCIDGDKTPRIGVNTDRLMDAMDVLVHDTGPKFVVSEVFPKPPPPLAIWEGESFDFSFTDCHCEPGSADPTIPTIWTDDSPYDAFTLPGHLETTIVGITRYVEVQAVRGVCSGWRTIKVVTRPPTLIGIEVTGPTEVEEDSQGQFTCIGSYSDGTTRDLTTRAGWFDDSSFTGAIASGVVRPKCVPSDHPCRVSARYGEFVDFADTTIVDVGPTLTELAISGPPNVAEDAGEEYQCTAHYCDAPDRDVTYEVTWSENSNYATIGSGGGLLTSLVSANEVVNISASLGGKTDLYPVTIVNNGPTLVRLVISGPANLAEHSGAPYTCRGYFSDDSESDVTDRVTWRFSALYGTIDFWGRLSTAYVSADQIGQITATLWGVTATFDVTIENQTGGAGPNNVQASDGTYAGKVGVSWSSVPGTGTYEIYRSETDQFSGLVPLATATSTTYEDLDATPGVSYYYWVVALVNGVPTNPGGPDAGYADTRPLAPEAVSASDGVYQDEVRVTWGEVAADYYVVLRNTSDDFASAEEMGIAPEAYYDDLDAAVGVGYHYWVVAVKDTLRSDPSTPDEGYIFLELPAVEDVQASDGTFPDKIRVEWAPVDGATRYAIYRKTTNSMDGAPKLAETVNTSFDDTSATPGTTYYYWVVALGTHSASTASDSDSGYAHSDTPAPADVQATDGLYADRVLVYWRGATGITRYAVYRSLENSFGGADKLAEVTETAYEDMTAASGATYYYWVVALDGEATSDPAGPDTGQVALKPAPPADVQATDGGFPDTVRVTWSAVAGAANYEVYRNTVSSMVGAVRLGETGGTVFDDTDVVRETTYYYWVIAVKTPLSSDPGGPDAGYASDKPGTPETVQASDGAYLDRVQVTWTAVMGADRYVIYRNTTAVFSTATRVKETTSLTWDDTTVTPGVTYTYWVVAVRGVVPGNPGGPDEGHASKAALATPANVQATDGEYPTKVRITWAKVSGATGYEIRRGTSDAVGQAVKVGQSVLPTFDDTTATPGTTYWYWVVASKGELLSEPGGPDSGYAYVRPAAPGSVAATDGTYADTVRVTWSAVDGADRYLVYRNGTKTLVGATKLTETTDTQYDDTTVVPGTTYYYWVIAAQGLGESDPSVPDAGHAKDPNSEDVTPDPPGNVQASDGVYADSVHIGWSASAADRYLVYRHTANDFGGAAQCGETDALAYVDADITAGTVYYYWVVAAKGGLLSEPSGPDTGYAKAASGSEPEMAAKRLESGVTEKAFPISESGQPVYALERDVAIRLTAKHPVAADSVWWAYGDGAPGQTGCRWIPASDTGEDGWVVVQVATLEVVPDPLTLTVGAATETGESVEPVTVSFAFASEKACDGTEAPQVTEELAIDGLPEVLAPEASQVYRIGPSRVFDAPLVVHLPVPDGLDAHALQIYYFSESADQRGWYRGDAVSGWLVPGSQQVVSEDGQTYLEFAVRHAGVVQLGQPLRVGVAGTSLFEIGVSGTLAQWVALLSTLLLLAAGLGLYVRKAPR